MSSKLGGLPNTRALRRFCAFANRTSTARWWRIAYALDVLRLDGIGLFSSVNDCYLGDQKFDPVFAELNRRKAVVFIHPTHCEAPEHTRLYAPPFVVEYVFDTTRRLSILYIPARSSAVPISVSSSRTAAAPCRFSAENRDDGRHRGAKNVTDVLPTLRSLYFEIASTTSGFALRSCRSLPIRRTCSGVPTCRSFTAQDCKKKSITGSTTTASMPANEWTSSNAMLCDSFRVWQCRVNCSTLAIFTGGAIHDGSRQNGGEHG